MRAVPPAARRLARVLALVLVAAGVVATAVGLVRWLDPFTDLESGVSVPVQVMASDGRGADLRLLVDMEPYDDVRVSGIPTGGLPHTDHRTYPLGTVVVYAPDASTSEKLLSRADAVLRGVALLVGGLALRPVLGTVAAGRPFARRDGRRVQVVGLCVVVGCYVAPLVPWLASASVLSRLGDPDGLSATPVHHLEIFVVAALVVLVGEVVRTSAPGPGSTPKA